MSAYYNEIDPFAAAWLRELIAAGLIAPGDVDERSIEDVQSDDLKEYTQCHFFAGIGGWSLALRLAGWADDRPVWTGSCPCPPFSAAGKRQTCPCCASGLLVWCPRRTGFAICAECGHAWAADPRHLWPDFWRLVAERRPSVVFGEQVASRAGLDWFSGVRGSLEIIRYTVGASDLCAAGVEAPHIRQRLFWVADAEDSDGRGQFDAERTRGRRHGLTGSGPTGRMADAGRSGVQRECRPGKAHGTAGPSQGKARERERCRVDAGDSGPTGRLADPNGGQSGDGHVQPGREHGQQPQDGGAGSRLGHAAARGFGIDGSASGNAGHFDQSGEVDGLGDTQSIGWVGRKNEQDEGRRERAPRYSSPWHSVPILCDDGKWRRVPCDEKGQPEPALFPLAHAGSVRNRVGLLRGSGNAINPFIAAAFVMAFMES